MWNYNPNRLTAEYGDIETCMEFYGIDYSEFGIPETGRRPSATGLRTKTAR